MISFINKHTLLLPFQYDFRIYKNSTDTVADLVNFFTSKLNMLTDVGALFIDVAKAFDSIDHIIILEKLDYYGFCKITNLCFKSCFPKHMQCVESNGLKSCLHLPRTGIPLRSILSSLVFILYINDLPLSCPDVHFVLFADDTIYLAHPSKL